jgi:hypothetical protein
MSARYTLRLYKGRWGVWDTDQAKWRHKPNMEAHQAIQLLNKLYEKQQEKKKK